MVQAQHWAPPDPPTLLVSARRVAHELEVPTFVNADVIAQGLKAMSPEERKRMTSRTRSEVKNLRNQSADGDRLAKQDQEFIELMIEEDPALFLRELPTKQKMELGPLLEEMHSRVQGMRR